MKRNGSNKCLVNLKFSKVFDRIDRAYLFHLLRKLEEKERISSSVSNRTYVLEKKSIFR